MAPSSYGRPEIVGVAFQKYVGRSMDEQQSRNQERAHNPALIDRSNVEGR